MAILHRRSITEQEWKLILGLREVEIEIESPPVRLAACSVLQNLGNNYHDMGPEAAIPAAEMGFWEAPPGLLGPEVGETMDEIFTEMGTTIFETGRLRLRRVVAITLIEQLEEYTGMIEDMDPDSEPDLNRTHVPLVLAECVRLRESIQPEEE